MSITRTYTVFCDLPRMEHELDHHGVSSCTGWTGETVDGTAAARKIARSHGWERIEGKDYCPAGAEVIYARAEAAEEASGAAHDRRVIAQAFARGGAR